MLARLAATEEVYQRGLEYYNDGAVREIIKSDHMMRAFVSGSQLQKYTVRINFDANGITATSCSCPYEGSNCKHIVATLFECLNQPETVLQTNAIIDSLTQLNESQLRTLIVTLAGHNPDLYQQLMIEIDILSKTQPPNTNNKSDGHHSVQVDPKPYKQAMRAAFRNARSGCFQDGSWQGQEIPDRLVPLIENIENFIVGNNSKNSILILETITTTFIEEFDHFENIYDD